MVSSIGEKHSGAFSKARKREATYWLLASDEVHEVAHEFSTSGSDMDPWFGIVCERRSKDVLESKLTSGV